MSRSGSSLSPKTEQDNKTSPALSDSRTVTLSLFGVPLGFAGFGGAWAAAAQKLDGPQWPGEILFAIGSVLWAAFTVIYVVNGIRKKGVFRGDLTHPGAGPFSAYIPLIAVLLAAHYTEIDTAVFSVLCWISASALAIVAAQLIALWLSGSVSLNSVHPGYFIPVVAGANVVSIGFSTTGAHEAALAAFGAGLFFWLVIGVVVIVRLFIGGGFPTALKPSMSGFLAASATSNLAWLVSHPGGNDDAQTLLMGVLVVMILVQVVLIPVYVKVPFGLSWWIFTFPLASTANFAVRWLALSDGQEMTAWAILAIASAFFLYVVLRSIILLLKRSGSVLRSAR